jgi:hypothetical protein
MTSPKAAAPFASTYAVRDTGLVRTSNAVPCRRSAETTPLRETMITSSASCCRFFAH